MKRIIALLCCVALLLSMGVVAAETDPTVSVDTVNTSPGASVVVPVRISNNPGIAGSIFIITYNEELTLTDVSSGDAFLGLTLTQGGDLSANPYNLVYDVTIGNDESNGIIANLTFTAPESTGSYEISVSYDEGDIINSDFDEIILATSAGSIVVTNTIDELELTGTITSPALGVTDTSSVSGEGVSVSVEWSPALAEGAFEADTAYTATVTVSPSTGSVFAEEVSITFGDYAFSEDADGNYVATNTFDKTSAKSQPTAVIPTDLYATYGDTLSTVTLDNPEGNTAGIWTWKEDGSTAVGNVGTQTHTAIFTPTDTMSYTTVEKELSIIVSKQMVFDAPDAPTLSEKTDTTISVVVVSGQEYSIDEGVNWNETGEFTQLTPNTEYSIVTRTQETDTKFPSSNSSALSVTTEKSALTGTVQISGTVALGETLTASVEDDNSANDNFSYQWKRGEVEISTEATYTLTSSDVGATITCVVTADDTTGSIVGTVSETLTKAISSIAITAEPTTKSYVYGETFNTAGMEVTATYNDETTAVISDTEYSVVYTIGTAFAVDDTAVTISYGGKTVTVNGLTVSEAVVSNVDLASKITAPAKNGVPDTTITDDQYTGTISWSPSVNEAFLGGTTYTATVTLTATANYTLTGITENAFSYAGATSVSNSENSGEITIVFPATAARELASIAVTTQPDTTTYTYFDDFSTTGMIVTATYDDGTTEVTTGYTVTDGTGLSVGKETVTIQVNDSEIQTTQGITVNKAQITITDATITAKTYDGSNTATVTDVNLDGLKNQETLALDTDFTVSGTFNSANVADANKVTVSVSLSDTVSANNYALSTSSKDIDATIAAASYTDATNTSQSVIVGDGSFTAPSFKGVNDAAVTGDITYTYDGATKSYEDIKSALALLDETATNVSVAYSFVATDTNYVATATEGTIAIDMVDIEIVWPTITVSDTPTYGDTWADILGLTGGSASLNGSDVPGAFTIDDADTYPVAGDSQTYTVTFKSTNGEYELSNSDTVTIAAKTLTASDLEFVDETITKIYDGNTYSTATAQVKSDSLVKEADTVSISGISVYDDEDVGDATKVTFTPTAITEGNYILAATETIDKTATITPATITPDSYSAVTVTKAYDGTTTVGTLRGTVTFIGNIGEDVVSIDAVAGAYADADASSTKTITLTLSLSGTDAGNYALSTTTAEFTSAEITAIDYTDATTTAQNVIINVGDFVEPSFTGLNGETVEGNITYTYDGGEKTYDAIKEGLALKAVDATASIDYSFTPTNTNYTGEQTGTIAVTMIDIAFTVDDVAATTANAITIKEAPTYGDDWSDIVTIGSVVAKVGDSTIEGTFSLDVTGLPNAGTQEYNVYFNDDDGQYTDILVVSGSVDVAKATITITADNKSAYRTYSEPEYTYTVTGLVGEETLATVPTTVAGVDVDMSTNGTYVISVSQDAVAPSSDNYNDIVYVDGTLTITTKSTSSNTGALVSSGTDSSDDDETVTTDTEEDTADTEDDTTETTTGLTEQEIANEQATGFKDVAENDWHAEAVEYAVENNLFQGVSENSFAPNENMTRQMTWVVLGRLSGQDFSGATAYADAKAWAEEMDVTDGTNPTGDVTREQLVTLLWRAAGSPEEDGDLSGYNDADQISDYALAAMNWAIKNSVISGMDATTLDATGNATRAQVAQIVMNYGK